MKIIEVVNHTRNFSGSFIKHSATVKISGNKMINKDIVKETSVVVGYHPAGYGLYGYTVNQIEKDTFAVNWKTGSSCD